MASVNKVILVGNLGGDPEMRYQPNGQAVTKFSVATNRSWKKDDEWQEEVTWHNITIWGTRAERAAENLRKGNQVYVEGRIENRQYDDKDNPGQKKWYHGITADVVYKMGRDEQQAPGGYDEMPAGDFGANATATGAPRAAAPRSIESEYDDLPF